MPPSASLENQRTHICPLVNLCSRQQHLMTLSEASKLLFWKRAVYRPTFSCFVSQPEAPWLGSTTLRVDPLYYCGYSQCLLRSTWEASEQAEFNHRHWPWLALAAVICIFQRTVRAMGHFASRPLCHHTTLCLPVRLAEILCPRTKAF